MQFFNYVMRKGMKHMKIGNFNFFLNVDCEYQENNSTLFNIQLHSTVHTSVVYPLDIKITIQWIL